MIVKSGHLQEISSIRLAIVGLVHDHVRELIPMLEMHPEVRLVGIVEHDVSLVVDFVGRYKLAADLFFPTLEALVSDREVEAVAVFTSTFDHRHIVEVCARLGIDVMMEKPLAVSLADARAITTAAVKGGIRVIVNYETTWYPSNQSAYTFLCERRLLGELRKIVIHDGHQGPKALGCSGSFLKWLTDPVLNGGGALMDFGCYGANLATWLMGGMRPSSVFAVVQSIQPEMYPNVEDEATVVLTYPRSQAIIQASWNWPYSRKDMEIYGEFGAISAPNRDTLHLRKNDDCDRVMPVPQLSGANSDPLSYFAAVVRQTIKPSGLSSLESNLIVSEILDAAKESARTGKRIDFNAD